MRKLMLWMVTTLDGFIADEKGHLGDWFIWDDEMQRFVNDRWGQTDTMVFGRVAYETIVPYWDAIAEGRTPDGAPAELTDGDRQLAAHLHGMARYVVSRTGDDVEGNATIITGDIASEIVRLKQQPGPDMLLACGPELLAALSETRLIDRYMVFLCPYALGRGRALFGQVQGGLPLLLVDSRVFDSGIILHVYEPAETAA